VSAATADEVYRDVMTVEPPATRDAARDRVFTDVWARPGLTRRERRWVTLVCVGFATDQQAMDEQVFAALNSGDITLTEMLEFILHFAVYCGWPKGSRMEGVVREQWARVCTERGEEDAPWPDLSNDTLGLDDWEARLQRGEQEFADVNLVPAPARNTPYQHAGILSFVFGHVWMRPDLGRRDRRFITVACVGVTQAPMPVMSHVGSALHSGDLTRPEMDELIRQFSAYAPAEQGAALTKAVEDDLFGTMLAQRAGGS
jgi:4-carboxymuconolactone decarboxylase